MLTFSTCASACTFQADCCALSKLADHEPLASICAKLCSFVDQMSALCRLHLVLEWAVLHEEQLIVCSGETGWKCLGCAGAGKILKCWCCGAHCFNMCRLPWRLRDILGSSSRHFGHSAVAGHSWGSFL